MKKVVITILVFLSLIALFLRFGYPYLLQRLGAQNRSGVKIESNPKAKVYICPSGVADCQIDTQQKGETPYQDENLKPGEYLIKLANLSESTGSAIWQGYVKLSPGTLSVINRELNESKTASSGEVITLDPGEGVTIVSTPTSARVSVDGVEKGKSPVTVTDIEPGEHTFIISHDNFLNRSIRANLVENYNLKIAVDLALSEADLTRLNTPAITSSQSLVVKKTPVGFLRVREKPSTNSKEVTQVKPGDELILLEELPNWSRIKTKDGQEGYVSSAYVDKKSP